MSLFPVKLLTLFLPCSFYRVVVDSVLDLVDYWVTFNEPHIFCMLTYCAGAWPGGNPDMLEAATSALPTGVFNQAMNWMAIAHSKAYDYIHEKRSSFPPPFSFGKILAHIRK